MIQIREGQELRRKDMPNVRILVCRIKRNGAWCACNDGYSRFISKRTLNRYYEHIPEKEEVK